MAHRSAGDREGETGDAALALVREVGTLILAHERYRDDWRSLALVGNFSGGRENLYGYVYGPGAAWEARLPGIEVLRLLRRLNDAMADASGRRWQRCLIQMRRDDPEIGIAFEYDDPQRWSVSPDTVARDVLALRPT